MNMRQGITSMWHVVSGSQCTLADVQWMGKENNTFMRIVPWCLVNRCLAKFSMDVVDAETKDGALQAWEELYGNWLDERQARRTAFSRALDALFVSGKVSLYGCDRFRALWEQKKCDVSVTAEGGRCFVFLESDPLGDVAHRILWQQPMVSSEDSESVAEVDVYEYRPMVDTALEVLQDVSASSLAVVMQALDSVATIPVSDITKRKKLAEALLEIEKEGGVSSPNSVLARVWNWFVPGPAVEEVQQRAKEVRTQLLREDYRLQEWMRCHLLGNRGEDVGTRVELLQALSCYGDDWDAIILEGFENGVSQDKYRGLLGDLAAAGSEQALARYVERFSPNLYRQPVSSLHEISKEITSISYLAESERIPCTVYWLQKVGEYIKNPAIDKSLASKVFDEILWAILGKSLPGSEPVFLTLLSIVNKQTFPCLTQRFPLLMAIGDCANIVRDAEDFEHFNRVFNKSLALIMQTHNDNILCMDLNLFSVLQGPWFKNVSQVSSHDGQQKMASSLRFWLSRQEFVNGMLQNEKSALCLAKLVEIFVTKGGQLFEQKCKDVGLVLQLVWFGLKEQCSAMQTLETQLALFLPQASSLQAIMGFLFKKGHPSDDKKKYVLDLLKKGLLSVQYMLGVSEVDDAMRNAIWDICAEKMAAYTNLSQVQSAFSRITLIEKKQEFASLLVNKQDVSLFVIEFLLREQLIVGLESNQIIKPQVAQLICAHHASSQELASFPAVKAFWNRWAGMGEAKELPSKMDYRNEVNEGDGLGNIREDAESSDVSCVGSARVTARPSGEEVVYDGVVGIAAEDKQEEADHIDDDVSSVTGSEVSDTDSSAIVEEEEEGDVDDDVSLVSDSAESGTGSSAIVKEEGIPVENEQEEKDLECNSELVGGFVCNIC